MKTTSIAVETWQSTAQSDSIVKHTSKRLFIYLFYLFIFGQKHITQGKKKT